MAVDFAKLPNLLRREGLTMKAIFWAPVIATALTANPAAADDHSASYYLPSCRDFINERFAREPFRQGECVGLIEGLAINASDLPFAGSRSCAPENVSAQLTAVVVRWLDQHPQRWHEDFRALALFALHDAWPCKGDSLD
jgi:Rap1a immunity proteins